MHPNMQLNDVRICTYHNTVANINNDGVNVNSLPNETATSVIQTKINFKNQLDLLTSGKNPIRCGQNQTY